MTTKEKGTDGTSWRESYPEDIEDSLGRSFRLAVALMQADAYTSSDRYLRSDVRMAIREYVEMRDMYLDEVKAAMER